MFKVLLLGRSNLDFSEADGVDASLPTLLKGSLRDAGIEHELVTHALYFGDRMASRARELVDREDADAVIVQIGTVSFDEDFVVWSVQSRWPRLYPFALRAAQLLKAGAGGGPEGTQGLRGELFRLPQAAARRVFGAEPGNDMGAALRCTKDTVDALAAYEEKPIAIQLMTGVRWRQTQRARQRVAFFEGELRAHCALRRVSLLSRLEYCRRMAVIPRPSGTSIYPDRATREADVRAIVEFLTSTLMDEPIHSRTPHARVG